MKLDLWESRPALPGNAAVGQLPLSVLQSPVSRIPAQH